MEASTVVTRLLTLEERTRYGIADIKWWSPEPTFAIRLLYGVQRPTMYLSHALSQHLKVRGNYMRVGWDAHTRSIVIDATQNNPPGALAVRTRCRNSALVRWLMTLDIPEDTWITGEESPDGLYWFRIGTSNVEERTGTA